ncbi:MAG: acetoin utilization protein AcuC, partial [Chloroflexi bacterium]|nr:acetoin utilization protein AcuC [Chloroflexota bacterium]
MPRKTVFVYDDALSRHLLSDSHPMKPERLRYTYELLDSYQAFAPEQSALVPPRPATEEEILQFHTPDYLSAVQRLSVEGQSVSDPRFNFGPGDNPAYPGMYEAASNSTGASLRAVEALLSGEADAAFSISGGLHHAMPGYAYGFCV